MPQCDSEKFNLDDSIRQIRSRMRPKRSSPTQYVAAWSEDDLIQEFTDGKQNLETAKLVPVKAFVIILRTRGCFWALKSGCSMCGYVNDSCSGEITGDDIMSQFNSAMQRYKGEQIVKIFNSGSFFDIQEIPREIRHRILKELSGKAKKVALETRVEFVNEKDLKEAMDAVKPAQLELGIGLESANDAVLEKSINKHMKFADFSYAASTARKLGVLVKTYLLVKPPFLTEREAIEDCVESVRKASPYTTTFSLNPMNIQNFTFVEHLFHRGEYRPPYLWSVAEILRRAKPLTNARLQCDPTGGGSRRGAHNCGKCDDAILADIRRFSLTQNAKALDGIFENKCDCKEEWKDKLEIETFSGP